MKPVTPLWQSTRLLDQVHERIRCLHYSLKAKKAYLYWLRFFIRWNAKQGSMRLVEGMQLRIKDVDFGRHVRHHRA